MGCISGDCVFGYKNSPEFDKRLEEYEKTNKTNTKPKTQNKVDSLEFRPYNRKEIDNYSLFEFWVCSSVNNKKVYHVGLKLFYDGREEWHCDCHDYTFKGIGNDYKCKHIKKCRNKLKEDGVLDEDTQ